MRAIILHIILLLHYTFADILNICLNVTNPLPGSSVNFKSEIFVDFDIMIINSLQNRNENAIDAVIDLIQLSESYTNYKYFVCIIIDFSTDYMCMPILKTWPVHKANQKLVLASLLPGNRAVTVRIVAQDTSTTAVIMVTEVTVEFTVTNLDSENDIDLLSLETNDGEALLVKSQDIFDEVYRIGLWQSSSQGKH